MLVEHWLPVFSERPVDEEAMNRFLPHTVEVLDSFEWTISEGTIASALMRTTDSMPGPDGVPYVAWRAQVGVVAPVLHEALTAVLEGRVSLLEGFNLSTMVFLPKAVPVGVVDIFSAEVGSTRPLTLTDMCPKILALAVNNRLSELASRTVMSQQPGFVAGRSLGDNLYELEAAMIA